MSDADILTTEKKDCRSDAAISVAGKRLLMKCRQIANTLIKNRAADDVTVNKM